jgi:hypothetical protein
VYAYVKPLDGYAFSPIELGAIDELATTDVEALEHLEHRRKYFEFTGDARLAARIERAMWAEVCNENPVADEDVCNRADCEVHTDPWSAAEGRPATRGEADAEC